MKILTSVLAALLVAAVSFAQNQEGRYLTGLSSSFGLAGSNPNFIGFGYSIQDDNRQVSVNLSPRVGYFFTDNLVAGLDLDVSHSSFSNTQTDLRSTGNSYRIGPFARYYFSGGKVIPFAEANIGFGTSRNRLEFSQSDNLTLRSSIRNIAVAAGVGVPVGDRFMFDVMAGYRNLSSKDLEDDNAERDSSGQFGLIVGFSVFLCGDTTE